ncbi:MAG: hypothetical protein ACRCZS_30100 [Chroococcidiopsis sp.]
MARADLYFHDPKPDNLNHWRPVTPGDFSGNGGQTTTNGGNSFTTANYSDEIENANTPQDLTAANPNCDRLTVQNLDSTDVLVIGIGEDAQAGRSYEIDPRGVGVIEEGEANQRISVMSAKAGLQFVAIARIRN